MADNGRGWHGDSEGHAKAGSQSSGNRNASENLSTEAGSKSGKMSSGSSERSERTMSSGQKGRSM